MQTLTMLNLGDNYIGYSGAKYLASALEKNTVRLISCSSIAYMFVSSNADTDHTES
jgi:hypothetical protein